MKIVFLYGHDWGGSFVLTQAAAMRDRGHEILVICPAEGPFTRACESSGIATFVSPFQGSRFRHIPRILRSLLQIVGEIRRFRPDVVHSFLIKAILIGRLAALLARVPKHFSQLGGPLTLESFRWRWMDLCSSILDTAILCPSLAVKRIYDCYWITRSKTCLLYYGFDQTRYTNCSAAPDLRGMVETNFVVTLVAYMYGSEFKRFHNVSIKGHEVLIDAAVTVVSEYPNVKFLVVGEDPDGSRRNFARFESRVRERGLQDDFIFTGFRHDIPAILACSDVAVVPSTTENCGGAVEPFAAGVPVIASNVGGLPEIVIPEVTGFLFSSKSVSGLAQSIKEAIRLRGEERARLGDNGRHLVRTLFDPVRCAEIQENLYEGSGSGQLEDYGNCIRRLALGHMVTHANSMRDGYGTLSHSYRP